MEINAPPRNNCDKTKQRYPRDNYFSEKAFVSQFTPKTFK